jgi:hypothetical protein
MKRKKKILTPIKGIRKFCLQCVGNQYKQVRKCPSKKCPIHKWRLGLNPRRKGIGGRPSHKRRKLLTLVRGFWNRT